MSAYASLFFWLASFLLLLPETALSDDWTVGTGGKPSRDGQSSETGPNAPTILWQGGLSAVIAQQAVTEGNILVMARIQDISDVLHGTRIVAQNLETGDTLWTAGLPVDFPSTDWRNRVSAIHSGRVYATRAGNTNQSYMYALNALTGDSLWQSQGLINETSTEGASFAPNGDLIVGNFMSLVRINATNGTTVWSVPRTCPSSDGCAAAVFGNKAYIWEASAEGPKVTAFNLTSGARLYSSPSISGGLVQQVSLFVGPEGTIYAPRTQNNPSTDFLVALRDNDSTLTEKWRVPIGYVPFASFAAGSDGNVYSYSRSFRVIRINASSGMVSDSSEVITSDFYQPRMACDAGGKVFVTNGGFSQGRLYSFDANLTTRWAVPITNVNVGGPALGQNGTLIVCGVGTDVRAYSTAPTGVANEFSIPKQSALEQNFPNPFNPSTVIRYRLSAISYVTLKIYDVLGRETATLVNEMQEPGMYGVTWDASHDATGMYFYRLRARPASGGQAGEFVDTKKLLLVK